MMEIEQWLEKTTRVLLLESKEIQLCRPPIVCRDGYTMSVQTEGDTLFATYKDTPKGRTYITLDVSEISEEDISLKPYEHLYKDNEAEEKVWAFVPIQVVERLIKKHGGIDDKVIFIEQFL